MYLPHYFRFAIQADRMNAYNIVACELSEMLFKRCLIAIPEYSCEDYVRMKLCVLFYDFVLVCVNLVSLQILNVCKF